MQIGEMMLLRRNNPSFQLVSEGINFYAKKYSPQGYF